MIYYLEKSDSSLDPDQTARPLPCVDLNLVSWHCLNFERSQREGDLKLFPANHKRPALGPAEWLDQSSVDM